MELTEEQKQHAQAVYNQAALVRDMMQHKGMEIVRAKIEEKTVRNGVKWYDLPPDQAELLRQDTKGFKLFFDVVKEILVQGEQARRALNPPSDVKSE